MSAVISSYQTKRPLELAMSAFRCSSARADTSMHARDHGHLRDAVVVWSTLVAQREPRADWTRAVQHTPSRKGGVRTRRFRLAILTVHSSTCPVKKFRKTVQTSNFPRWSHCAVIRVG